MFLLRVFILLLASGSICFAEVARPSNLKVVGVEDDTPTECRAFFHETGWEGSWDNVRPHELWIESIHKDCTAQVVYSFGVRPGKNDVAGYFRIIKAEIKDNTMSFNIPSSTAKITVLYKLDNDTLSGTWQSSLSTNKPATALLIKRK